MAWNLFLLLNTLFLNSHLGTRCICSRKNLFVFLLFLIGLLASTEEVINLYFSLYKCIICRSIPVQLKWGFKTKCITKKGATCENSLPSLLLPSLDLSTCPVFRWGGLQRKTEEVYYANTRCIPSPTIKLPLYTSIPKIQPVITITVFF